jgi:hypothetical protein
MAANRKHPQSLCAVRSEMKSVTAIEMATSLLIAISAVKFDMSEIAYERL